jgi:uncharacterized protein
MELSLEDPGDFLFIRGVEAQAITVVDRRLETSFVLARDRIEDWPATDAAALTVADMQPLLDMQPDVILLGTGSRQVFPPAEAMVAVMRRGIGIEVMDNAAAARTHAVLAGEGRNVVAAFIL